MGTSFYKSLLKKEVKKMNRTISRKEIFQREIQTGATITEIEIYTNSLQLVLTALSGREYVCIDHKWIFSDEYILSHEEQQKLIEEIKDLKKKIRKYKKRCQNASN